MTLEDKVSEVSELLTRARAIVEALECAETVENEKDFAANLADAADECKALATEVADLRAAK